MSNQINGSFSIPVLENKKNINFQQNATVPQYTQQTSMQGGVDGTAIKQSVDNSYLANRARASQNNNPVAVAGIGAATWYGIAQGMEKLNAKSNVEYSKSIYGQLGNWGDKFTEKTWLGRQFQNLINKTDAFLEKLSGKSKIVNSLKHHSTSPEWQWAKMPMYGPHGFLTGDAEQVLEEFFKPISGRNRYEIMGFGFGGKVNAFQNLEQYGLSQKEINAFKDTLKHLPFEQQMVGLQRKEIKLLTSDKTLLRNIRGINDLELLQEIAKELKAKKLGLSNFAEFEALKGNFLEHPDKLLKMFETAAKDPSLNNVSIWRNETTLLGKIKSHLFGRKVGFKEYFNKFLVTTGKGNKSTLGRALPKGLAWLLEGGTNRFGGGKLAVAMQAGILADIIYNTVKAPKGEHIKTFMERCVNDFTYFIGMTVGILAMHKVGGFKHAGLKDAKAVEAFREAKKAFDARTVAREFASKKEYKKALKTFKKEHLGLQNIKNPITKLLQKIGSFLNIGNERFKPYQSNSKVNLNWLRKLGNGNILGVPMRFLIPMAVVTPFLVKLTTTTCHKIFGRPTHSVLDEEEETENKEQQNATPAENQPPFKGGSQPQTQVVTPPAKPKNPQDYTSDTNLIKMTANGQKPVVRTYIPSPECKIPSDSNRNGKQMAPERSYIPSPEGIVEQGPDMTAANNALAEADMTEKYINETLAALNK